METTNKVTFSVTMSENEAAAIAQFFKRVGHDDYHRNSDAYHPGELENMKWAGNIIREALAKAGFNPR